MGTGCDSAEVGDGDGGGGDGDSGDSVTAGDARVTGGLACAG